MRWQRFRDRLFLERAGTANIVDDLVKPLRGDTVEMLVVNHQRRAWAAGGETFDRGNREETVGCVLVETDAEFVFEPLEQAAAAGKVAGERPANLDVELAAWLLREHRVERDDFPDVDRLQSKFLRRPFDLFPAEIAKVLLQ